MWYYSEDGQTFGPMPKDDLLVLITGGRIKTDTLVWHDRLDEWKQAAHLEEFASFFAKKGPPPLPNAPGPVEERKAGLPHFASSDKQPMFSDDAPPTTSYMEDRININPFDTPTGETLARPWPRFWARMIDIVVYGCIIAFAFETYMALYHHSYYTAPGKSNDTAYGMILLFPTAVAIALSMAIFGNSVGKAVLGIKVQQLSSDSRLWFYLKREINVWFRGLGLGIPIISLIINYHQYKFVSRGFPASYDVSEATVVGKPIGFLRALLAVVVFGGLFVGLISLGAMDDVTPTKQAIQTTRSWTNPVTQQNVVLASDWVYDEKASKENNLYYFVDSKATQAMLAHEATGTASLDEYVEAIKQVVGKTFTFEPGSTTLFYNGRMAKRITGKNKENPEWSLQITMIIKDGEAWRTIVAGVAKDPNELPTTEPFVRSMFAGI